MAADPLSRVFSALADPTRRDMVARLAVGDATVNELAEPYDVTVQAVSKHLKVLEDAGLVSRTRDAQRRPCHLEAEVFDLMTKWIERYRREAEERFSRLDDVLAGLEEKRDRSTSMSATTRNQTSIEVSPAVPTVTITREFDAPVALVFRAYTEPDLFRQWIGPRNRTFELQEFDCRTGGAWRYSTTTGLRGQVLRGLPRGAPRRADRADVHLRGLPRPGRPRDRRRSRTSGAAARGSPRCRWSTPSRRATGSWPAAWSPASSRATRSSTSCSRPSPDVSPSAG